MKDWNRLEVKRWMVANRQEHIDPKTNELNCTSLAESTAQEFDIYENDIDFPIPEELFEMAGKA